jgi:hypothetical protein
MFAPWSLVVLLIYAVGLVAAVVIPYWVIRLAVRHALVDTDDRRARTELRIAELDTNP